MAEAFNIVKRYEVAQPDLKRATIAALFSDAGTEFGKFWKEVGRKRGFTIEGFDTIESAKNGEIENEGLANSTLIIQRSSPGNH